MKNRKKKLIAGIVLTGGGRSAEPYKAIGGVHHRYGYHESDIQTSILAGDSRMSEVYKPVICDSCRAGDGRPEASGKT